MGYTIEDVYPLQRIDALAGWMLGAHDGGHYGPVKRESTDHQEYALPSSLRPPPGQHAEPMEEEDAADEGGADRGD